jgi:glycerophosphoryl diester phosphodiesterase
MRWTFRGIAVGAAVTPRLELDIQLTRDGVPVVYHDAKLNPARCVREDGGAVERRRISEMRLDEVLELAVQASYPVRVSIEIKVHDGKADRCAEELARNVVEALRSHGLERRAVVQSFQPEALRAVAELAPEIGRALERLVGWGVDGIITDYPERALETSGRPPEDAR